MTTTPTIAPIERLTVTVEEAAQLLGISRSCAYECVRTGQLPSIRLGRRLVIPTHKLTNLLEDGSSASQ